MRSALRRVRDTYGSHPLHLILLLACFALAAYTVLLLASGTSRLGWMAVWFLCALLGHDLVLFPVYAVADRLLGTRSRAPRAMVPVRNYVRMPLLASGLLFLLFLPGIIQQGEGAYHAATGQFQDPFLARYLLCVAALFVISALVYATRVALARRARGQRQR